MDQALVVKEAELKERMSSRQALISSEQAKQVDDISELLASGAWAADGSSDAIAWVMGALNLPYLPAADLVSLAVRLEQLPVLRRSFADGAIGVDSAGAAAKLANPETDEFFTEVAETSPAKDLLRAVKRNESLRSQKGDPCPRPILHWSSTTDGWYRFSGFLAPDQGARLVKALQRAEDKNNGPDPITGGWDPAETKAAEALLSLAEATLCQCKDSDRARTMVNVHIDARSLVTGEGSGELDCGGAITAEMVRKLACDAKIRWIKTDDKGLVGVGTKGRGLPEALVTYLRSRDQGCRFPGCSRTRHLHAHHIIHWANGGPTNVTNLTLLCNRHHGLIHEGGWHIEGSPEPGPGPNDTLRFVRPDGTVFIPHPMVAAWRSGAVGTALSQERSPAQEGPFPDQGPPPNIGETESLF